MFKRISALLAVGVFGILSACAPGVSLDFGSSNPLPAWVAAPPPQDYFVFMDHDSQVAFELLEMLGRDRHPANTVSHRIRGMHIARNSSSPRVVITTEPLSNGRSAVRLRAQGSRDSAITEAVYYQERLLSYEGFHASSGLPTYEPYPVNERLIRSGGELIFYYNRGTLEDLQERAAQCANDYMHVMDQEHGTVSPVTFSRIDETLDGQLRLYLRVTGHTVDYMRNAIPGSRLYVGTVLSCIESQFGPSSI